MTEDFGALQAHTNHVIVCGYGIVGKFVVKALREENVNYVIVDNSYKHVLEAIADGEKAFYGDMSKMQILEKLHLTRCHERHRNTRQQLQKTAHL